MLKVYKNTSKKRWGYVRWYKGGRYKVRCFWLGPVFVLWTNNPHS